MPTISAYWAQISGIDKDLKELNERLANLQGSWAIYEANKAWLEADRSAKLRIRSLIKNKLDWLITDASNQQRSTDPNVITSATTDPTISNTADPEDPVNAQANGGELTDWTQALQPTEANTWTVFDWFQWTVTWPNWQIISNPNVNLASNQAWIASNLSWRVDNILEFLDRAQETQIWAIGESRNALSWTTGTQLNRLTDFFKQARRGLLATWAINQWIAWGVASRAWASTAQRIGTLNNLQAQTQQQVGELWLSQLQNEREVINNYLQGLNNAINAENAIRWTTTQAQSNLQSWLASDLSWLEQSELGFQRSLPDVLLQRQQNELANQWSVLQNQTRLLQNQQLAESLWVALPTWGLANFWITWLAWLPQAWAAVAPVAVAWATWWVAGVTTWWGSTGWWSTWWWGWTTTYTKVWWWTVTVPTGSPPPAEADTTKPPVVTPPAQTFVPWQVVGWFTPIPQSTSTSSATWWFTSATAPQTTSWLNFTPAMQSAQQTQSLNVSSVDWWNTALTSQNIQTNPLDPRDQSLARENSRITNELARLKREEEIRIAKTQPFSLLNPRGTFQ